MNKTMEYMAYCLPSVSFNLHETRVSAGDTTLFVESGDITAFANAVESLLDDDELRTALALAARRRVEARLDWRAQAQKYVAVFDRVTKGTASDREVLQMPCSRLRPASDSSGDVFVDLSDPGALDDYLRHRWRLRDSVVFASDFDHPSAV
jgi:hypothetical protein